MAATMSPLTSSRSTIAVLSALLAIGLASGLAPGQVPAPAAKPTAPGAKPAASPGFNDYANRVVAYIYHNTPITRKDLGEYLIARCGGERLEVLVNKKIIEKACKEQNIEATSGEVDAVFRDDIAKIGFKQNEFVSKVLQQKHKTLYEWKEDVLRPQLLLTKLCQHKIKVTAEEVNQAFETAYGAKVDCKIIIWPLAEESLVRNQYYPSIRNNDAEFDRVAKAQAPPFGSCAGHVKPIGRYNPGNPLMEIIAKKGFALKEGETSEVLKMSDGLMVIKCLKHLAPDPKAKLEVHRARLEKEVFDRKIQEEIPKVFQDLYTRAKPVFLLPEYLALKPEARKQVPAGPPDPGSQVVAWIYGNIPITREDFGEYLIASLGGEKVELLVNKMIIEKVCRDRKITASEQEINAVLKEDLAKMNVTPGDFVVKVLRPQHKTMYEWKEDAIKPQILLTKLCRDRVRVTEEDLAKAFNAYYGEKVDCKIILWPQAEENLVRNNIYARIRDSEAEFDRVAKTQASSQLASKLGHIAPVGRDTTGNPDLERALFALQPGEITPVIKVPEGFVVARCIQRIPADKTVKLAAVRAGLEKEIIEKKILLEIPRCFAELREQASVDIILKENIRQKDLERDVRQELGVKPTAAPAGKTPAGK